MNPSGFYVDPGKSTPTPYILSQNAQGKYTFSLFFFLRCTLYYAVIALDKFRFAAANHTVSICGLYGPQLATVEPAIAKRGFC